MAARTPDERFQVWGSTWENLVDSYPRFDFSQCTTAEASEFTHGGGVSLDLPDKATRTIVPLFARINNSTRMR